jgi:phage anti-repressor protein
MSNSNIVRQDIASLLDGWIEAEKNGVQFPVPFEAAWRMAEYSNKANAKQSGLKSLKKGKQFSCEIMKTPGGGRSSELINLSVDGFKHFCLMADTKAGEAVRQYFIETEKKWKLVQEISPQFAEEIEILKLRREIAQIETQKAVLEDKTLSLRHYVVSALPKATADRILGVTEIKEVEIRTKIVDQYDRILNAADTVTKTELAHRYGFVTKTGKPDTKLVSNLIDEAIASGAISEPWHDVRVVTSPGFDADLVPTLDRFHQANPIQRQMWMGEN